MFLQARSEHRKGAALADLRSALERKLSTDLDTQVPVPHLAGNPQKGALRPPATSRPPHATPGSYDTALARHRMSKENHGPPAFASLQRQLAEPARKPGCLRRRRRRDQLMRHVRLRTLLVARICSGAVARKGAVDEFLGERVTVG